MSLPLLLALVLIVTALAYLPLLQFGFNVATDDYFFILLNPKLQDTSLAGMVRILATMSTRYNEYQPVTFLTLWLDHALWGLRPAGYYAAQIFFHLVNVVLVFTFLRKLTGQGLLALITALLFALHPLQVDTMAMLNQRENLLSTALALGSLSWYLSWKRSGTWGYYGAAFLGYGLSLLADSPWLVLPVLLLAVDLYEEKPLSVGLLVEKIPFFCVMVLYALLTVSGQESAGMTTPYHFGTLESQIRLVLLICSDFVASFFFPFGLSTGYSYSPAELGSFRMLGAVILVAGLLILLLVSWKRRWRIICFGLLWFGICIAPFSHIVPYQIVRADHDMYHALIGLAVVTSAALVSGLKLENRRKGALLAVGAMSAGLAVLTLSQLQYYRTPYAYIQRFVDTQGWAPSAEILLARVHQFYGHYDAAERSLRKAIEHLNEPLRSGVRLSLADLYVRGGRFEEALAQVDFIPQDSPNGPAAARAREAIRAMRDSGAPRGHAAPGTGKPQGP